MNPKDIALAEQWASIYLMRGFQPLPSSPTEKKPLIRYADLWEKKVRDDVFARFRSSNVQVMCGRSPWRLLVIDLDGPEAQERWQRMGRCPRTWTSHSGGDGRHLWFRLPEGLIEPLPKAFLWKGDTKHQAIERLCDHSLVMAPPSIHPRTGRRYRWLDKWHSPLGMGLPADCPTWILRLRPVVADQIVSDPMPGYPRRVATPASERMDRDEVIRAINPIAIAREWGIRFDGKPTQKGWQPCHAWGREDKTPSAAIHRETGVYVDRGSGLTLSFFDLAVSIAGFKDWIEAKDALAQGRTRP